MKNGYVIEGMNNDQLADRLVEVGEARMMLIALKKRLPSEPMELHVTLDTAGVQEAIDAAVRELGVYGEIDAVVVAARGTSTPVERIEMGARTLHHAQFGDDYRNVLLALAALVVDAIKLHDQGKANVKLS